MEEKKILELEKAKYHFWHVLTYEKRKAIMDQTGITSFDEDYILKFFQSESMGAGLNQEKEKTEDKVFYVFKQSYGEWEQLSIPLSIESALNYKLEYPKSEEYTLEIFKRINL